MRETCLARLDKTRPVAVVTRELPEGAWPFDAEWIAWRPDPAWTIPQLEGLDELRPL